MSWTVVNSSYAADPSNRTQLPLNKPTPGKQVLPITAEIEEQVALAFEKNDCAKINTLVVPEQAEQMRPVMKAVLGYCYPDADVSEKLFLAAEMAAPTKDIVWVLHARRSWKKDPASSLALWRKVQQVTRSRSTKEMAEDYIQGTVEAGDEEELVLQRKWTYFINAQIGESHESNPSAIAQSDTALLHSGSLSRNLSLGGNLQRNTGFGSIAVNYSLLNNRYPTTHLADYLMHSIDLPVAIKADVNADVTVRPFYTYSTLGNVGFQTTAGLGILGWVYKAQYNQSVQGLVYRDFYKPLELQTQQGLHFRIEYNWEFYPNSWFLKYLFSFEHVSSDTDTDPTTHTTITYSHNDIGFNFFSEYRFGSFTLGFSPRFLVREDDNTSTYQPASGIGPNVTKRRQDLQVYLTPSLTIPITQGVQIYSWYEYNRIFSNMNGGDYADRNVTNHAVGVALRAFVGNF